MAASVDATAAYTMSNTFSASVTTSGPMWSPGSTTILPLLGAAFTVAPMVVGMMKTDISTGGIFQVNKSHESG